MVLSLYKHTTLFHLFEIGIIKLLITVHTVVIDTISTLSKHKYCPLPQDCFDKLDVSAVCVKMMDTLHFILILSIVPTLVCGFGKYHISQWIVVKYNWKSSSMYNIIDSQSHFQITDIAVHPQSVNTTLNSTVSFTCEAVADLIDFRVNDSSAANVNIINRGFTQQLIDILNGGKLRRELLALAFKDNNNTNISCRAINSEIAYSDIAVLRIQGELML